VQNSLGDPMAIQDELPKSRLTLRYRTEINGEPEDIELPLRLLVMGDFSGKDTQKNSFEERKIYSFNSKNRNLNEVMQKMHIKVNVEDSEGQDKTLALKNIDSFLPGNIITSIPSMDEMVKAKNLLNSLLSCINNSSKFRKTLTELLNKKVGLEPLRQKLEPSYKSLTTLPAHVLANEPD
jgi:type VI secretion system protein ImpB